MRSYNEQLFKDALYDEWCTYTDLIRQKEILDAKIEKSIHVLETIGENWRLIDAWVAGKDVRL